MQGMQDFAQWILSRREGGGFGAHEAIMPLRQNCGVSEDKRYGNEDVKQYFVLSVEIIVWA